MTYLWQEPRCAFTFNMGEYFILQCSVALLLFDPTAFLPSSSGLFLDLMLTFPPSDRLFSPRPSVCETGKSWIDADASRPRSGFRWHQVSWANWEALKRTDVFPRPWRSGSAKPKQSQHGQTLVTRPATSHSHPEVPWQLLSKSPHPFRGTAKQRWVFALWDKALPAPVARVV